jgi:SAM-dependent methyltransferase
MILSPWAVRNVPFDAARYAGFHGYDVDYCFTARQAGGRVIVTDIDLFHFTKGGFGDAARYECSNAVFMEKWFPAGREANVPRDGTARRQKEGPPAMPTALPTPQARLDTSGGVPLHKHNGVLPEIRIDLGGGKIPLEGSLNLDPCHGEGPWRRLAQDVPWPVDDNTVDKIYSSHMMEHVPAGAERIAVMNEAWRVLRIGGTFEVRVPMFPRWEAIADPTHVSFWVPQSFLYFTGDLAADADYGIKRWTMDSCTVNDGWELRAVLRKPETA